MTFETDRKIRSLARMVLGYTVEPQPIQIPDLSATVGAGDTEEKKQQEKQNSIGELADKLFVSLDLNGNPKEEAEKKEEEWDGVDFGAKLANLGTVFSNDITRFTIACKPPADPATVLGMTDKLGETCFRLAGYISLIPKESAGLLYRQELLTKSNEIFLATASLLCEFLGEDTETAEDKKDHEEVLTLLSEKRVSFETKRGYLIKTGICWEACQIFEQCSRTNQEATRKQWGTIMSTLDDAISEVQEMIDESNEADDDDDGDESGNESDDSDDSWGETTKMTEEEKQMSIKCQSLLKLTKMLLKKLQQRCLDCPPPTHLTRSAANSEKIPEETRRQLSKTDLARMWDQLYIRAQQILAMADDMGSSLYSPQDRPTLVALAKELAKRDRDVVLVGRLFVQGQADQEKWLDLCETQLDKILASITVASLVAEPMPFHPSGPASRRTQGQSNGQHGQSLSHRNPHVHAPSHAQAPQSNNNNTPYDQCPQQQQHLQPSSHSYCIPSQGTFSSETQELESGDTFSNFSEAYAAGISIPTAAFNTARFGELEIEGGSVSGTGTGSHRRSGKSTGVGTTSLLDDDGRTGDGMMTGHGTNLSITARTRRVEDMDNDDFGMDIDSDDFLGDDDDFDLPQNLEDLPDFLPTQFPTSTATATQDGGPVMMKSETAVTAMPGGGKAGAKAAGNPTVAGRQENHVMTQPIVPLRTGAAGGLSGASTSSGNSLSSSSYFIVSREEQALKEQIAKLQQKNSEMETQIKEKDKEITMRMGENIMLRQDRDRFKNESERLLELSRNAEIRHSAELDQLKKSHQRHVESLKMDHQFEIQNVVSRPSGARLAVQGSSEGPPSSQFPGSQTVRQSTQRQPIGFPASQQQLQQQPSPSQFGRRDSIPLESFGLGSAPPPTPQRTPIPAPARLPDRGRHVPVGLSTIPMSLRRPNVRPRPTISKESSIQRALLTENKGSTGLRKLGAVGIGALNLHYRHVPGSDSWTKFAKLERQNLLCVEALVQLTVHVTKETIHAALETTFQALREAILLRQPWMMAQLVSVLVALMAQLHETVQDWICAEERARVPFFARVAQQRFLNRPRTEDPLDSVREALQLRTVGAEMTNAGATSTSTSASTTAIPGISGTGMLGIAAALGGDIQEIGDEIPAPAQELIPTPLSCIFYLLALLALTPPKAQSGEEWSSAPSSTFSSAQHSESLKDAPLNSQTTMSFVADATSTTSSSPPRASVQPSVSMTSAVPACTDCIQPTKHSAVSLSATRATIDMSFNVAAYESDVLQLVEQTVAALLRSGQRSLVYPLLHLRILEAILMSRHPEMPVVGGGSIGGGNGGSGGSSATSGGNGTMMATTAAASGHVYERTMAIFWQLVQDPECCRVMCGGSIGNGAGNGEAPLIFEGSTHLVDVLSRQLLLFPPNPCRSSRVQQPQPQHQQQLLQQQLQQQKQQAQPAMWFKTGGVVGTVLYREQEQPCHWSGAVPRAKVLVVKILRELTRVSRGQTQMLVQRTGMVLHCIDALREQVEVCLAHCASLRRRWVAAKKKTRLKSLVSNKDKDKGGGNNNDHSTTSSDMTTRTRRRSLGGGIRSQDKLLSKERGDGDHGDDDIDNNAMEEEEEEVEEDDDDDEGEFGSKGNVFRTHGTWQDRGRLWGHSGVMSAVGRDDAHSVVLHLLTFLNNLEGAVMSSHAWLERTYPEKVAELASCASIVVAHQGLVLHHSTERGNNGSPAQLVLQGMPLALHNEARQMLVWVMNDEQKEDERIALAR
ncbi:hypothetical protein BGW41_002619 [Actinomortierella wolfii]|nr:hypothetical protein BGW41_002619 [Actinomortierella wolfii]